MDRFDFEQQMMDCWSVVDDLQTAYEYVCEPGPDDIIDPDKIANLLLGLRVLYQLKHERLHEGFEQLVTKGAIR